LQENVTWVPGPNVDDDADILPLTRGPGLGQFNAEMIEVIYKNASKFKAL